MSRKISWKQCIRELMKFVSPYKWKFFIGMGAIILATVLYAVNPVIEGSVTTQLSKDAAAMLAGEPGAGVHFGIVSGS